MLFSSDRLSRLTGFKVCVHQKLTAQQNKFKHEGNVTTCGFCSLSLSSSQYSCFFLTRSFMSVCVSISLNDFLSLLFTTTHIHTSCLFRSFSFFTLRSSSHTICLARGYSAVNQPSIFLELLCAYYYNYTITQSTTLRYKHFTNAGSNLQVKLPTGHLCLSYEGTWWVSLKFPLFKLYFDHKFQRESFVSLFATYFSKFTS